MKYFAFFSRYLLPLLLIIAVYLTITVPTASVHGISNDEFLDFGIGHTLSSSFHHLLNGSDVDPTQSRLPMFLSGLFCSLFNEPSIVTARYCSIMAGVLALVGIYLFGCLEFSRKAGLLAAGAMAISPYFLAFSRTAFTEGDAFTACASIWLMLAIAFWRYSPSLGRTALVACAVGITVSAKVIVAAWVPFLLIPLFYLYPGKLEAKENKIPFLVTCLLVIGLFCLLVGFWKSGAPHVAVLNKYYDRQTDVYKLTHYLFVLFFGLAAAVTVIIHRKKMISVWWSTVIILTGSVLVFFIFPPSHTTNGSLLQGLYREFLKNHGGLEFMTVYSAAGLNVLSLIIKSGLSFGVFMVVALLVTPLFIRRQPILILPFIMAVSYPVFLIAVGRAQTFYMMAVLPQFILLAVYLLSVITERYRMLGYGLVILFAGHSLYDVKLCYPDFQLNGYQWLGERYIAGRSSVNYKGIVQTQSDGTTQVIEWAKENISDDSVVITYLRGRLVKFYLGRRFNYSFRVYNGFDPASGGISKADYVLIHINYLLDTDYYRRQPRDTIYIYPFDKEELHRDFEKVYSVTRAFGIEMASVWKRKKPFAGESETESKSPDQSN